MIGTLPWCQTVWVGGVKREVVTTVLEIGVCVCVCVCVCACVCVCVCMCACMCVYMCAVCACVHFGVCVLTCALVNGECTDHEIEAIIWSEAYHDV